MRLAVGRLASLSPFLQLEGSYSLIVLHLPSEVQLQFCMGRGSSGSNFPLLWGEDGSSRRLHNLLALQI